MRMCRHSGARASVRPESSLQCNDMDSGPASRRPGLTAAPRLRRSVRRGSSAAMAERPKAKKPVSREERLRAALRENLKRRKAQARGRTSEDRAPPPGERGGPEKSGC
jgi:hypothetical protein